MRSDVFEGEAPADYLARLAALPFGKTYKSLALRELAIAEGHVVSTSAAGRARTSRRSRRPPGPAAP